MDPLDYKVARPSMLAPCGWTPRVLPAFTAKANAPGMWEQIEAHEALTLGLITLREYREREAERDRREWNELVARSGF